MHLPPRPIGSDARVVAAQRSHKHFLGIFLALWLGLGTPGVPAQEAQQAPQRPQRTDQRQQAGQNPEGRVRPGFRLTTLKPPVGGEVTLRGHNLRSGSQVTARLTAPNGSVSRMSARVEENGRFIMVFSFPNEGTYRLVVRGQGLQMTRTLQVQPQYTVPERPQKPKSP